VTGKIREMLKNAILHSYKSSKNKGKHLLLLKKLFPSTTKLINHVRHYHLSARRNEMGLFSIFRRRRSFSSIIQKIFGKKHARIGIYGPPNVGKTTLANRILRDWTGDIMGSVSEIPHETRRAKWKTNIKMENGGSSLIMDLVDTPGISTKIDYKEFMNTYGLSKEESRLRAKEATEGVIEAIRWLDDIDGVVLVMDSTKDPFTQVNVTIIGNLEARDLPVLIAANKIDEEDASPATLKSAFPQHPVVPISALTGYNTDKLYSCMVKNFGKRRRRKRR
jgi:hypothetical protein